jgi:SAM-dependent methyltransferase
VAIVAAIAAVVAAAGTAEPVRTDVMTPAPRPVCPVCEGTDIRDDSARWRSGDPARDWTMSRCGRCRTVFVDPLPDASTLAAAYPDDFYGVRRNDTERIEEWFLSRRLRLAGPVEGLRVLDVGSGDGKFLRRCRAAGAAVVMGVEPSARGREATAALGIDVVADLSGIDAGERFDVVTLWHSFEHVADPRATAEAVAARVAPGGRVLVAVPNVESFEAQRFGADWFHLDVPRHLVFAPADALRALFEGLGLRHARTHRFSVEYDPYGLLQSALNRAGSRHNALYHRLKRKWPLSAYDRRGRVEVVAELVTLPVTGAVSVLAAAALARAGRTGTYTSVFAAPREAA